MIKIKCNELIPKECESKFEIDKDGNNIEIAGEICEVKCICGYCLEDDRDD